MPTKTKPKPPPPAPCNEPRCPHCDAAQIGHSGWLFQEAPDTPPLAEPVQLLRCYACWKRFRADGAPYDECEQIALWAGHRGPSAKPTAQVGP